MSNFWKAIPNWLRSMSGITFENEKQDFLCVYLVSLIFSIRYTLDDVIVLFVIFQRPIRWRRRVGKPVKRYILENKLPLRKTHETSIHIRETI